MKIVVNKCYGGFGLSPKAIQHYLKLNGQECFFYKEDYNSGNFESRTYNKVSVEDASNYDTCLIKDYGESFVGGWKDFDKSFFSYYNIDRSDKKLIETIEELGEDVSSGSLSRLKIVEIPNDIQWELDDYDGIETIHEIHRSW